MQDIWVANQARVSMHIKGLAAQNLTLLKWNNKHLYHHGSIFPLCLGLLDRFCTG